MHLPRVAINVSQLNLAVTDISEQLAASTATLQWVVNGYALAFASLLMAASTVGRRVGLRRGFRGGLVVFAAASVLGAWAPNGVAIYEVYNVASIPANRALQPWIGEVGTLLAGPDGYDKAFTTAYGVRAALTAAPAVSARGRRRRGCSGRRAGRRSRR